MVSGTKYTRRHVLFGEEHCAELTMGVVVSMNGDRRAQNCSNRVE